MRQSFLQDYLLPCSQLHHQLYSFHVIKVNVSFALIVKLLFVIFSLLNMGNIALAIFADVGVTLLVILYSLRLMNYGTQEDVRKYSRVSEARSQKPE